MSLSDFFDNPKSKNFNLGSLKFESVTLSLPPASAGTICISQTQITSDFYLQRITLGIYLIESLKSVKLTQHYQENTIDLPALTYGTYNFDIGMLIEQDKNQYMDYENTNSILTSIAYLIYKKQYLLKK